MHIKTLFVFVLLVAFIPDLSFGGTTADIPTVLLEHFDGSNGSTTFIDSANQPKALFRSGTTYQISTTQSKFGGSSLYADGSSSFIENSSASSDFLMGTQDFTIDVWAYPVVSSVGQVAVVEQGNLGGWLIGQSGANYNFFASQTVLGDICNGTAMGSADLNTWTHLAVVRHGSTITTYKNGISQATCTTSASLDTNPSDGYAVTGYFFQGYIDEVRVVKGLAMWTANFTPPAQAYITGDITFTKAVTITGGASVLGTVSKGSGTFVIDHPLDPKNKLLYHSFVESPDVKNIYDGVATLDRNGDVTIELPDYFLALNKDFRYLASAISPSMPNLHLSAEIHRKYFNLFGPIIFSIAGGAPGGTISWQVTGIRHDPFILANPIVPIVEKSGTTIVKPGVCLFPPLCQ